MIQQSPPERADVAFLRNLAERLWQKATPAMGFDQSDTDQLYRIARLLASQAAQPAEADGWVMVPREPSDDIALAIVHELQRQASWLGWEPNGIWKAALAATPKAPATDAGSALSEARVLIQEAKGLADGENGGSVTDHLDSAESWLDKVEAALATPPAPNDDLRAGLKRLQFEVDFQRGYGSPDIRLSRADGDVLLAALKENRRG